MNLRDQLLAAAARVFAEAGYRGATTRRIASEAGVNQPCALTRTWVKAKSAFACEYPGSI